MGPIVVIKGGLGNQLFQWTYAHSLNTEDGFYPSRFHYGHHDKIMNLELNEIFKACPHVLNHGALSPAREYVSHLAEWLWVKGSGKRVAESILGYYQEDPRNDQKQRIGKDRTAWINSGYFQNNKYANDSIGAIQLEILPHAEKIAAGLIESKLIPRKYSVVHIRTGIYSSQSSINPDFIGNLHERYFLENLDKLKANYLIVLTENANHISSLLNKIKPDLVLDSNNLNAWETLATMTLSQSMIGSNSSLSWWGAKLASFKGTNNWLPDTWSIWNNINSLDYRFTNLKVLESRWRGQ